jgi:sodium transport system ATP-binding protein
VIRVNGLRKQFGAVVAVNDVTFAAPNGAVTAVLGPNGAGKTTSLRMITGLLRPTDGTVDVDGIDPQRDPVGARRRLGVLPDGAGLYGRLTAFEHLQYAARLAGLSGTEARTAIDRVTQVFSIGALAKRPVTGFSQGEQRRVALARAVIHDPPNVLLDEPTGALDVLARRAVRALVRQLADRGHAVVITTHIMSEAEALSDRIVVIARGKVAAAGTPAELQRATAAPTLEAAFIRLVGGEELQ